MIPIKHAAQFKNGAAFKPSDWGEEGLPILRIAQLTGKPFDNFFQGTIPRYLGILNGDLLFSWSATIDAFIWNRGDAILNQHIFKVIPKKNADKKYLYYVIKHHAPRWSDDDAHGSTMRHIKKESLSNKVYLPDLATQRQIADFLDHETARIDLLIEKKKRLVALLEKRVTSLITEISKHGLSEETLVETGINWWAHAPKKWEINRIATLFSESKEMGEDGLPVLSVSINWGISDRELADEDRDRIVNLIDDKTAYKRVRPGDLVYNMMRAWQGGFGVAKVDGLVSPAYVVARPKRKLHSEYFEHLLRTPSCVEEFRRASKGIADFRQRLYWEHFRQVRLALPPISEQVLISEKIDAEKARIAPIVTKTNQSIDRLKEYRSALITAAVTGQIDVQTYTKSGTPDRRLDAIQEEMGA